MELNKWQWLNSLRIKLIMSVMIMTLPLVCMLIYNNIYAIDVVRGKVSDSYKSTLDLYIDQLDTNLNDIDAYMNSVASSFDLLSLSLVQSDEDYYLSKVSLNNKLYKDIALYRSNSGFFVYAGNREDYMAVPNGEYDESLESENIQSYVIDLINRHYETEVFTNSWQVFRIGQQYYLVDIVKAGNAYMGAWINTDHLITPVRSLAAGNEGEILLSDDLGNSITRTNIYKPEIDIGEGLQNFNDSYYLSGDERKYLVVSSHSERIGFSLVALIPDKHILANLPYLQRIIWFITIATVIFIPTGLYLMRKIFLVPLNKVLLAMRKVRNGDWGVRVNMNRDSDEFVILGESFNSMMTEIQTLRVNVYEEQLNKQREELQRLQLQINPHFFLNSLNIVYNLAKVKNHDLIMEMSMSLIHYFRYLFRSNTSFVKLQSELDHTQNYLRIQSLRFPSQLTWNIDAPNYLMDIPVPPLLIQSFVENTIKHAITMDDPVDITIKLDLLVDPLEGSRIFIEIRDNGCGFDEEILMELQAGRSVVNDEGEHTGIWNIQRRLGLLYGDHANISFANDSAGGAVVTIIVPVKGDEEAFL